MPIYSRGLGIYVARVRQAIDAEGRQLAYWPFNDPAMLPVVPLHSSEDMVRPMYDRRRVCFAKPAHCLPLSKSYSSV